MKCPICNNKLEEDEIKLDICDQGHSVKDIIKLNKRQKKEHKQLKLDILEWVKNGPSSWTLNFKKLFMRDSK